MNVAAYVEALQQDLANVAGIGDEAVAEAARRIAAALESSLRLRLTDALGEAAAELTNLKTAARSCDPNPCSSRPCATAWIVVT